MSNAQHLSDLDQRMVQHMDQAVAQSFPASTTMIRAGGYDPTLTIPDYLHATFEELGRVESYLANRDLRKIRREQLIKLCEELCDYQYKHLIYLITVGWDLQKKELFYQYLKSVESIQQRVQHESAKLQRAVINSQFENRVQAIKEKSARDAEFRGLYQKGILNDEQYAAITKDNDEILWQHIGILMETMRMLLEQHGKFLYMTLQLFKDELIDRKLI